MEEDARKELEIVEFYQSLVKDRNICNLGRLWRKSLRLGKRIAVAGAMISSASLILPPLVAISTLGIVFSVPFGFVFVSYACIEMLMSRLLEGPKAPAPYSYLENGSVYLDEGAAGQVIRDQVGYEECCDMEEEERNFEDVRQGIERRIQLEDEENTNDICGDLHENFSGQYNLEGSQEEDVTQGVEMLIESHEEIIVEVDKRPVDSFRQGGDHLDSPDGMEAAADSIETTGYVKDEGGFMEEEKERPIVVVDELQTEVTMVEDEMSSTLGRENELSEKVDEDQTLDALNEMLTEHIGDVGNMPFVEERFPKMLQAGSESLLPIAGHEILAVVGEAEVQVSPTEPWRRELPVDSKKAILLGRKEEGTEYMTQERRNEIYRDTDEEQTLETINENEVLRRSTRETEDKIRLIVQRETEIPSTISEGSPLIAGGCQILTREEADIEDSQAETRTNALPVGRDEDQVPTTIDEMLKYIDEAESIESSSPERINDISTDVDKEKAWDAVNNMLMKRIGEAEDEILLTEQMGNEQLPLCVLDSLPSGAGEETMERFNKAEAGTSSMEQRKEEFSLNRKGKDPRKTTNKFLEGIGEPEGIFSLSKGIGEEEGVSLNVEREDETPVGVVDQMRPEADDEGQILEGIREAEHEIALMERRGYGTPVEAVRAVILGAEGVRHDRNAERAEELSFLNAKGSAEEIGPRIKFGDVEPEELERETTGLLEEIRDEGRSDSRTMRGQPLGSEESHNVLEGEYSALGIPEESKAYIDYWDHAAQGSVQKVERENSAKEHVNSEEYTDACVSEEILIVAAADSGSMRVTSTGKQIEVVAEQGRTSERQAPAVKKLVVRTKMPSERMPIHICIKRESLVPSDAVIREGADESGLDMFGVPSRVKEQAAASDAIAGGKNKIFDDVVASSEGYHENPISFGAEKAEAFDATSRKGPTPCFDKLDEGRLWEYIFAMRTVLGYKEAARSTCAEELKALFTFTGVEPPASLKDFSDISENLMFLMAIVGVKAAS